MASRITFSVPALAIGLIIAFIGLKASIDVTKASVGQAGEVDQNTQLQAFADDLNRLCSLGTETVEGTLTGFEKGRYVRIGASKLELVESSSGEVVRSKQLDCEVDQQRSIDRIEEGYYVARSERENEGFRIIIER